MSLSIITSSTEEFFRSADGLPEQSSQSSLTLSFESDREALLAKQAFFIKKFAPDVFKLFPDFIKYDPTNVLPTEIRGKAIRLCPKNILGTDADDISAVISSCYSDKSPDLVGSIIGAFFNSPLIHALRVYLLLKYAPKVASIKFDKSKNIIDVQFDDRVSGFWYSPPLNQIQTADLQETLSNNLYLGLAFPITSVAYEEYVNDEIQHRPRALPDDFYKKRTINDLLILHVSNNKITRRSWEIDVKQIGPHNKNKSAQSAENWLSAY